MKTPYLWHMIDYLPVASNILSSLNWHCGCSFLNPVKYRGYTFFFILFYSSSSFPYTSKHCFHCDNIGVTTPLAVQGQSYLNTLEQ